MDEIIQVQDKYYILATAAHDDQARTLKHGDTFALFDRLGNIRQLSRGDQGVYHDGTRFLSRLELRIAGMRPILLSSSVVEDNSLLAVDLTNPDIHQDGTLAVAHGTLHVFRSKFLFDGGCHERIRIQNFGREPVEVEMSLELDADFRDIFEVRGTTRARRGAPPEIAVERDGVVFSYRGLDEVRRAARVRCSPQPAKVQARELGFRVRLEPAAVETLSVALDCEIEGARRKHGSYDECFSIIHREREATGRSICEVSSSNASFNQWMSRSTSDLRILVSATESGPYPYAGVPWYSTVFGRDGIITALQVLWLNPDLARGVLRFLAASQATRSEPERDAEPGKIVHEMRRGEMAALGEIPFGRYYGTVDATPLFVLLAAEYFDTTGDRQLIEELWPNLQRSLEWMSRYGDADQDGFLEYEQRAGRGLSNQGWKDSADSVSHADGALAEAPIALCEVQAYGWAAHVAMARLAGTLGHEALALEQRQEAEQMRERFERSFWCEDLSTYAIALDGNKRPCRIKSSNAGHCLYSGIASPERALLVARQLMSPAFFSGWGIRTLAEGEVRYNPMSYHNGSIWPHDNALIAAGFARYGLKEFALKVFEAQFEASRYFDLHRIPELYCGFVRRDGEGPISYPVACAPQAWAAGSAFMLLQACLGMVLNAKERSICFNCPMLPAAIDTLYLRGLRVGDARVDLAFHRYPEGAGVEVLRRIGAVEVSVLR